MDDSSGSFQAGWNLAESMLFDIGNRLRVARNELLNGNLEKYFWNLESIVRMLYGFLTEDEKKTAYTNEMEIMKLLPMKPENKAVLSAAIKKYDGVVMIFLHEHKLLVPPKVDRTRLIA